MDKQQLYDMFVNSDYLKTAEMTKAELREIFGSEFAVMKDYKQDNPHHCYDLLIHTLKTVEGLNCEGLTDSEKTELQIAALFHDIGKPKVAFIKKGKMVFYNHAAESEKTARIYLTKFGFSADEVNRICFYIKYHDEFISFKLPEEIKDSTNPYLIPITAENVSSRVRSAANKYAKETGFIPSLNNFSILMRLCEADAKAQAPVVIQNGITIDSAENKKARTKRIAGYISDIKNTEIQ